MMPFIADYASLMPPPRHRAAIAFCRTPFLLISISLSFADFAAPRYAILLHSSR